MPSQFTFTCPHCAQPYAIPEEQKPIYVGKTISCQKCQTPFIVTAPPEPIVPTVIMDTPIGYATPAPNLPASGLAIASLVLGIVSLCASFLTGIPAIICGILAIKKARRGEAGGKGLAIAGLTLGIVTCIFLCLPAILLPSLNKARETANRVYCASNMRQIGQGILLYTNANGGQYPDSLATIVTTQSLPPMVLRCPSSNGPINAPYSPSSSNSDYIYLGQNFTTNLDPNSIVLYEPLTDHTDGINVLFADGRVAFIQAPAAQKLIADLEAGLNPSR